MQDQSLEDQAAGNHHFVASLEKGLLLISCLEAFDSCLEAFDATRGRLALSDVAKLTGITRSATRRYLLTLTKLGYA